MPMQPLIFRAGEMRETHRKRVSRLVIATPCVLALAGAGSGQALAAGSGYGGTPPPVNVQPVGFRAVIVARTIGRGGGSVNGEESAGPVVVVVPRHAYRKPFQVAITKGSLNTVWRARARALARYRVVAAFGIEIRLGASSITTSKPLTVVFTALAINRGYVVAFYDSRTGKFTRVRARVIQDRVTLRIRRGESIAILAPPGR